MNTNEKRGFWDRFGIFIFLATLVAFAFLATGASKLKSELEVSRQDLKEAGEKADNDKKVADLYDKAMSLCGTRFQGRGNEIVVTYLHNCPTQPVKFVYTADKKWVDIK